MNVSIDPALANVVNDVVPSAAYIVSGLESYQPITMIFPLESVSIPTALSLEVPPILLAHCGVPLELYFTMKASLDPTFAKLIVTGAGAALLG